MFIDSPLNNPHMFYFEIRNKRTDESVYTFPYTTEKEPTEKDVDEIVSHQAEAIKEKQDALGWKREDLSYHVCHHSPLPSKMGVNVPFYIDAKVNSLLKE